MNISDRMHSCRKPNTNAFIARTFSFIKCLHCWYEFLSSSRKITSHQATLGNVLFIYIGYIPYTFDLWIHTINMNLNMETKHCNLIMRINLLMSTSHRIRGITVVLVRCSFCNGYELPANLNRKHDIWYLGVLTRN